MGDQLGGGVLIAVSNELSPSSLDLDFIRLEQADFDIVACEIKLGKSKLILACFYIPPEGSASSYMELATTMNMIYSAGETGDEYLFYGDANLRGVKWVESEMSEDIFDPVNLNDTQLNFLNDIHSMGLFQICNKVNVYGNVLDLVFTSLTSNFILNEAELTLTDKVSCFHKILSLNYYFDDEVQNLSSSRIITYDFANANYESLNWEIQNIEIGNPYIVGIDHYAEVLESKLMEIIDKNITKKIINKLTCPPHMDKALRILRNARNKAYKKWHKSGSEVDFTAYTHLREQFKLSEAEAIYLYNNKIVNSIIDKPKQFWQYVNDKRHTLGYPVTMKIGDTSSSSAHRIAGMFAEHFESKLSKPLPPDSFRIDHIPVMETALTDILISREEITSSLQSLDINKGSGPDMIPPAFLKNTADSVSKHLLPLFNASLSRGVYPTCYKLANVTPVFKSGDRSDISNYRSISILSAIGKVFEKLVTSELFLAMKKIIDPYQHGFMSGRSTVTNLVEYSSYIRLNLADRKRVDAIYTDFSSAFDKVDHGLLICKLERYGIRGSLLNWIQSYLTGRTQKVKFMSDVSNPTEVLSGVPQGSILGPLLFILFTNDISYLLKNARRSLYADDLKLYKVIENVNDSIHLQEDLNILYDWCSSNGMSLNVKKCAIISFNRSNNVMHPYDYRINNESLNQVTEIRDLGVIFDTKLTFKSHTQRICNSGRCMLGFIKRRVKELNDPYLCKTLYCSIVLPLLEFASVVWAPFREVEAKQIESIQKQFLIFALSSLSFNRSDSDPSTDESQAGAMVSSYQRNIYKLPPYESRLLLLNMTTLANRRKLFLALFIFDIIKNNINCDSFIDRINYNVNRHNLRHQRLLRTEYHAVQYAANDTIARGIHIFNEFSDYYNNGNVQRDTFKNKILMSFKNLSNNPSIMNN
jgi:hypothetical protein